MMRMMGMDRGMQTMMRGDECPMEREDNVGMGMSMNEMTRNLVTLKGEEFDKVFIETMTEHHQGAIDMANLIPGRSDRSELKTLGENIISAQSKEIEMMKGWLKTWFQ